jgi:hypothetical protein
MAGKSSRVLNAPAACGVAVAALDALENQWAALLAAKPRRSSGGCERCRENAKREELIRLSVGRMLRHLKSAAAALGAAAAPAEQPTTTLDRLTPAQRVQVRVWIEQHRRRDAGEKESTN